MTKHTSGNWEVTHIETAPGKIDVIHVGKSGAENGSYTIAMVPCFGESAVFNAQLIAAAPELLAALKHITEKYTKHTKGYGYVVDAQAAERALEAIRKAEGE